MPEKIRPMTHSSFKAQEEADLPDIARHPSPGGSLEVEAGTIEADAGPFSPVDAAALRATHGAPNKLGRPYTQTEAERALAAYLEAFAAYKADYQGTRSERLQRPYLEAKQRMIDLGLMTGDV